MITQYYPLSVANYFLVYLYYYLMWCMAQHATHRMVGYVWLLFLRITGKLQTVLCRSFQDRNSRHPMASILPRDYCTNTVNDCYHQEHLKYDAIILLIIHKDGTAWNFVIVNIPWSMTVSIFHQGGFMGHKTLSVQNLINKAWAMTTNDQNLPSFSLNT